MSSPSLSRRDFTRQAIGQLYARYGKTEDCRIELFDCGHGELQDASASGQCIISCGAQLRPATTPMPSRHRRRRSASFLERFQEGYQVSSFLARENEAQMSLVVANHIFDRRSDSVVEVRRARGEGA
jgi:hypothetical protein